MNDRILGANLLFSSAAAAGTFGAFAALGAASLLKSFTAQKRLPRVASVMFCVISDLLVFFFVVFVVQQHVAWELLLKRVAYKVHQIHECSNPCGQSVG